MSGLRKEEETWLWGFFVVVLRFVVRVLITPNRCVLQSTPKSSQRHKCSPMCGTVQWLPCVVWHCCCWLLVCLVGCPLDRVLLTHHLFRHAFHMVVVTGNIYLFPWKKKFFSVSNDLLIAYLFSQIFSCQNILIKVWPVLSNQENNFYFQFHLILDCQIT